jgi:tetratricopeptide (TPR) repeat protein
MPHCTRLSIVLMFFGAAIFCSCGGGKRNVTEVERQEAAILRERALDQHVKGTDDSLRKAIELQRRAISVDPSEPHGYSGLAHILVSALSNNVAGDRDEMIRESREAAEHALRINAKYGDAWSALIRLTRDVEFDLEAARRTCAQVLRDVGPRRTLLMNCGMVESFLGNHDTAIEQMRTALADNHDWVSGSQSYAEALFRAGRYSEALIEAESLWSNNPDFPPGPALMAKSLVMLNRAPEALAVLEKVKLPEVDRLTLLTMAYARAGRMPEAHAARAQLSRLGEQPGMRLALAHAAFAVGDEAAAWKAVDEAVSKRESMAQEVPMDPYLAPMLTQSRLDEIRRKLRQPR